MIEKSMRRSLGSVLTGLRSSVARGSRARLLMMTLRLSLVSPSEGQGWAPCLLVDTVGHEAMD